ncbi:hypothetical protein PAMA_011477 [Pampus argenteus]
MEDSETAEDGLLAGLRWNRSARDQAQLKHKIRDLPGLLKHGLHLRKKSQSPDTIPGPSTGPTVHKSCSQSFPCAGRAVRNAFLSHGPYPAKDKIHLARIIRRSYVGVELVQWLCEQCVYVRCRTTAVRVWQVLLELGVLLSVDQRVVFSDSNSYYQFSFEECDSASCDFRSNEGEWSEAVRLLLQLAPYVQFRSGGGANSPSEEDSEGNRDICSEILQMKALERLTSTVQSELAAALARKTRKALSEQDSETTETSHQEPRTPSEESSPLGGVCALRDGGGSGGGGMGTVCSRDELTSRLGLEAVQRLAKDGCRLLQNHNYRLHDRNQAEALGRVCLKERGRDVLVLRRVTSSVTSPSERPSPTSSGSGSREEDCDKRYEMSTKLATLAEAEEDIDDEDEDDDEEDNHDEGSSSSEICTFDIPHFPYIDDDDVEENKREERRREEERRWRDGNDCNWCSSEEDCCGPSSYRYVVVSGTPLKILEHLLSDLRLDDQRGAPESRESELKSPSSVRCRGQEEGKDALFRKRKVLQLVSHWSRLYKDFLKEEEHVRSFMKTLYRCVLEDLYEFPTLERDLKEFQKLLRRRHTVDDCPPNQKTHASLEAHELLRIVGVKMDKAEEDMVLAVVSHTGERRVLQPSDCVYSESLTPQGKLVACRRDLTEILQELVYYTLSRAPGTAHTAALSVLLQRCNEVQQWVMSEVLMCVSLNKRVQLLKKFIKIAAHCKAQRNLNSAFAIIMGLNTAAVSRLNQTWEKCPGKFKKLFSELELITDPSLNHKAYREAFKRMKPPKIPFMPLLLKDITFIHEGNKTFHDNLVNFEKLHMIADTVRLIRHCQSDQPGNEVIGVDSADVRASVHHLHIIDNQQTLFELSHKLEPRA